MAKIPNYLAGTQKIFDTQAQQMANQGAIKQGLSLANSFADQAKLDRLRKTIDEQYKNYYGIGMDPGADPSITAGALQNMNQLDMFGASLDFRNVNEAGDLYKQMMDGRPDISKMLSDQAIAKIRADALARIAIAKNASQEKIQRDKNISSGPTGLPADTGLSGGDAMEALFFDDLLYGGQ